jgi:hypothetical protein
MLTKAFLWKSTPPCSATAIFTRSRTFRLLIFRSYK